jgi:hypothetical protein
VLSARVTACCPTVTATRFARPTIRRALRAPERPVANIRLRAAARLRKLDARADVLRRLRPVALLRPRDELRDLRDALERPRDERLDFLRPPPRDLLPLDLRALAIVNISCCGVPQAAFARIAHISVD